MADLQHYEFVVEQRLEGKWKLRRILAVFGYIAFVLLLFVLGVKSKLGFPLLALAPLFCWMLVFFTWRYTRPEYEIVTVSNSLRFTVVYGGRTRRPQCEVEFRKMHRIAPLDDAGRADVERFKPDTVYAAVSSMKADDLYYAIWEEDKKHYVLYFEATEQLLKICRYYNSAATVVTSVSR
ncbi:MAG: hypothetical protein IKD37_06360 [Clostridia bacterium]|nr:hypothetical protein [Clostridia bacterium]